MLKSWNTFSTREKLTHLVLYLIGVGIMPAGAVLTINAHLGAGGYDALNFVLADLLHIRTSLAIYGTAFIILITAALIRKSYPRVETFLSSFFMGISTDFWKTIFNGFEGTNFISSLILMGIGMIIIAFAVASCAEEEVIEKQKVVDLLNEQQATIRKLQDLCGESDGENAKLLIENKKLKEEKGYWKSKAMTLLMQVRRLTPRMTNKEVIESRIYYFLKKDK